MTPNRLTVVLDDDDVVLDGKLVDRPLALKRDRTSGRVLAHGHGVQHARAGYGERQ